MKIGVDAGCLGVKDNRLKVGVYTVVANLLIELSKLDKKNQYYLYSFYPIEESLVKKFGKNMKNIVVTPSIGWLKFALPIRLVRDNIDIFLAANQAMPLKLPLAHFKTIGLFYDIAFEKHPELYSYAASVEKHKRYSRELAEKSDKIIAISQNTKNDIEKTYHINSGKIRVAYPGFQPLENSSIFKNKRPYFLFVGAFKKSKNVPFLIHSFILFLKNTKKDFDLLLVGGDKWMDPEIQQTLNQLPENSGSHIQVMRFVDSHTLASLYRGAFAFVSPSLYEGFGLPFVEAQSVGIPVIGSNQGSLPEIIGRTGLLVNPKNNKDLTAAMVKLSTDKNLHKKFSQEGLRNAKKYSWKMFAKEVQSTLESL